VGRFALQGDGKPASQFLPLVLAGYVATDRTVLADGHRQVRSHRCRSPSAVIGLEWRRSSPDLAWFLARPRGPGSRAKPEAPSACAINVKEM
jgi:hypothetical protein